MFGHVIYQTFRVDETGRLVDCRDGRARPRTDNIPGTFWKSVLWWLQSITETIMPLTITPERFAAIRARIMRRKAEAFVAEITETDWNDQPHFKRG
jgi:hypothetical protein